MTLLNALLLVTLLAVALLTALVIEQNRQAELEARLELLRLARTANRQSVGGRDMRQVSDRPRQVFIESHGFFQVPQLEASGDSPQMDHAA